MKKKGLSIKLKLTLWFTGFMALLAALCLGLILIVSSHVTQNEAFNILSLTVRNNIPKISSNNGYLSLDPDFEFYSNEVYMLIYNQNQALISGQAPPQFPVNTALENGVTRFVSGNNGGFYVLDFWIPTGWDDGFWLRGVLLTPDGSQMINNIFLIFSIILPFFILMAATGGYLITRRALSPISQIADTAGSISEGKDLTRRIQLSANSSEAVGLANAFNHMFEQLERSFEAEKQFTSDASHELRTPTAVILAQCSYAQKHGDTVDEYREAIDVIERQAQKMSLLIDRLLDMTRLDLGTQKLRLEKVDLSEMVSILCEEQDTGLRQISIQTQIESEVCIKADPFLISRVIGNLLDNARKYGKEGGTIQVRLFRSDASAVLEVEDDGIGIAEENLEKIWQRFYQANPSRESSSGLGLGLSMVRQIVLLHSGTVSVKSLPGTGSTFTVTFPLAENSSPHAADSLNFS